MDKQQIAELFLRGQDCGQVVIEHYADRFDMSKDELNRISAAFGGGLGVGETCGAIVGAMMVLGLLYGHKGPDDMETRNEFVAKRAEFLQKWAERREQWSCRDLLGHDISKPGEFEKVIEEGLLTDFCPELVLDAIAVLDEMLA